MAARSTTQHAKAAKTTRSTTKTPTRRATPYDAKTKARALKTIESKGIAAAHKAHGIPKPTLTRWAKAAGLDLGEQARARTAHATEAVRARAVEVKASTVDLLESHVAQAGDYLATVAGVNALAARLIAAMDPDKLSRVQTLAGSAIVVQDPQTDEVIRVAEALGALPLSARDAEGILTRAVHDLALLNGEATERGELLVEFAVPRPRPATVVEQDALGIEAP